MSSWSSDGVTAVSNLALSLIHTYIQMYSIPIPISWQMKISISSSKKVMYDTNPNPIYTIFLISEILGEGSDSEEGSGSSGEDSSEEEDSEGTTL